jgi:hypothetical protein
MLQEKDRLGVGYLGCDTVPVLCGLTDILEEHEDGGSIYLQNVSGLCQTQEMREMHSSNAVLNGLQENRQKT